MRIPTAFDETFLAWFRETTEEVWARHVPKSFEDYVAAEVGAPSTWVRFSS
jgi:hypothetical protein